MKNFIKTIRYGIYRLQHLKDGAYAGLQNAEHLKKYLAAGGDPNKILDGQRMLEFTVVDTQMTQMLFAAGANANLKNSLGLTPLTYLVEFGDNSNELTLAPMSRIQKERREQSQVQMLQIYLENKADPNITDPEGVMILKKCFHNMLLIEPLLQAGAKPDVEFLSSIMKTSNQELTALTAEKIEYDTLEEFCKIQQTMGNENYAAVDAVYQKRMMDRNLGNSVRMPRVNKL